MDNAIVLHNNTYQKVYSKFIMDLSKSVCAISLFILIQKNLIYSNVAMIYSYLPKKR